MGYKHFPCLQGRNNMVCGDTDNIYIVIIVL